MAEAKVAVNEELLPTAADLKAVAAEDVDDDDDVLEAAFGEPLDVARRADEEEEHVGPASEIRKKPAAKPFQGAQTWGSNWSSFASSLTWGNLVDTVKKQTELVADVYKRDLGEFVSVVSSTSTHKVESISTTLMSIGQNGMFPMDSTDPVEESSAAFSDDPTPAMAADDQTQIPTKDFSSLTSPIVTAVANLDALADKAEDMLEQFGSNIATFLSSAISVVPPEQAKPSSAAKTIIFDRKSAAVAKMQKDPSTYLTDPLSLLTSVIPSDKLRAERFIEFKANFLLSQHSTAVARLLHGDAAVARLLEKIVPLQVSAEDFWLRYFFRLSEVEMEEETRKRLMTEANLADEEIGWESDNEDDEVGPVAERVASLEIPPSVATTETSGYEVISRPGSAVGLSTMRPAVDTPTSEPRTPLERPRITEIGGKPSEDSSLRKKGFDGGEESGSDWGSGFTQMVKIVEAWFKADDGVEIYTRTWQPEPESATVATVVAVHGLGEHIGRYDEMFTWMAKSGIKIHGFDQRGFGRTGRRSGILGHNDSFARTLKDVKDAETRVMSIPLPHFIFGHSMGGCIALNYAARHPENLKGVIASAPLVGVGKSAKVSIVEYYIVRGLAAILGTFPINNPVNPKTLAKDQRVAEDYLSDPNVHPYVTFQTAVDIVWNGEQLLGPLHAKFSEKLPLLITHGTADLLTDPKASRKFFDMVKVQDKVYESFEDGFHELHNDFNKGRMYSLYTPTKSSLNFTKKRPGTGNAAIGKAEKPSKMVQATKQKRGNASTAAKNEKLREDLDASLDGVLTALSKSVKKPPKLEAQKLREDQNVHASMDDLEGLFSTL